MGKLNCKIVKKQMGKKIQSADCVNGYSLGLNKGFIVTKNLARRVRPSNRKGYVTERIALLQKTIKSVAGFSPYEKRAMEMFKVGNTNLDKRAKKFLKKRLGTWSRANRKSEEIQNLLKKKKN